MRDGVRWLIIVAAALLLIGLIAYARGDKHHHGDDVGALPAHVAVVRHDLS